MKCLVSSTCSLFPKKSEAYPFLKLTVRTWKWMVGILVFFWDGLFSGAMFFSRECTFSFVHKDLSVISCYVLWWDVHHGLWARHYLGIQDIHESLRIGEFTRKTTTSPKFAQILSREHRKPSEPWKIFCFLKIVLINMLIDCIRIELHSWIQVHVSLPECIEVLCLCIKLEQRSCFFKNILLLYCFFLQQQQQIISSHVN